MDAKVSFRPKDETRTTPAGFAPLRRDPIPPGNLLSRYITAYAKAFVGRTTVPEVASEWWPDDRGLGTLVKAASTPAQLGQAGWAAELGQRVVNDTLSVLFPASAGAALFQLAPSLTFGNEASIAVPGLAVGTIGKTSAFVAERQPIPVFQPTATNALLLPYKLAGIMVATREMIESSNAENLLTDLIRQSFGRALDEVLVDGNPVSALRPAGLRNGIAALTASAGSDAWTAFVADVSKLTDAVSAVAGNSPIAFIGSAGRKVRAQILGIDEGLPSVEVFGSNAVINDFLCVATAALVSVIGVPEVEVNKVATVTLDDAPAADPTDASRPRALAMADRRLWHQMPLVGILGVARSARLCLVDAYRLVSMNKPQHYARFDAQDLAPVIACEHTPTGWRGLTQDGEILNVYAHVNGSPVLIPDNLAVTRGDEIIGYRAIESEANDGIIADYVRHLDASTALLRKNDATQALAEIDVALTCAPTILARYNRAMILLQLGRWQEGFDEFAYCEQHSPLFMRPQWVDAIELGHTPWRGENLAGKKLLLIHDHGFGDTIMMLRYVPLLQAMGAEVCAACAARA